MLTHWFSQFPTIIQENPKLSSPKETFKVEKESFGFRNSYSQLKSKVGNILAMAAT
jgi:hypothetical protein